MGLFLNGLILMLAITSMMYLGSATINQIDPTDSNSTINFNCKTSMIGSFTGNNSCDSQTVTVDQNMARQSLTNLSASNTGGTGVSFVVSSVVNIFNGAKNWLLGFPLVAFVVDMVTAPSTILRLLGFDNIWVFGVGAIWNGIMLFLIFNVLRGNDP